MTTETHLVSPASMRTLSYFSSLQMAFHILQFAPPSSLKSKKQADLKNSSVNRANFLLRLWVASSSPQHGLRAQLDPSVNGRSLTSCGSFLKLIGRYLIYIGPERLKFHLWSRVCTQTETGPTMGKRAGEAAIVCLNQSSISPSIPLAQAASIPLCQLGKEALARQLLELQAEGKKLELQKIELQGNLSRAQDLLEDVHRELENAQLDYTIVKGFAIFQIRSYQGMTRDCSLFPQPLIDDALSDEVAVSSVGCLEESAHIEVLEDEIEIDRVQLQGMAQWISKDDLIQKNEAQANQNEQTQEVIDQLKQTLSLMKHQIKLCKAKISHLGQRKQELAELTANYSKEMQALITQAKETAALLPSDENQKKKPLALKVLHWIFRKS